MFSIINTCAAHACTEHPSIRNKAHYLYDTMPYIDIAIGIILVVIGVLALKGYIPMNGAAYMIGAGAAEIAIALSMRAYRDCSECCCYLSTTLRRENGFSILMNDLGKIWENMVASFKGAV